MRKYILAKTLSKKYGTLAHERYNKFGCNDKLYKTYCKVWSFACRVLNKNGWDNCI